MVCDDTCPPTSSTTSPLPTTHASPLLTIGAIPTDVHGSEDMIFVPIPGRPTPEFVHTELSQVEKLHRPPPKSSHIEQVEDQP